MDERVARRREVDPGVEGEKFESREKITGNGGKNAMENKKSILRLISALNSTLTSFNRKISKDVLNAGGMVLTDAALNG